MLALLKRYQNIFNRNIHFKELVQGSAVAMFFKTLSMGMNFLFFWMVARWYGADVVGAFSLGFSVLTIFTLFGKIGIDVALLKLVSQYVATNKSHFISSVINRSLKIVLLLNIILTPVMYFSMPYIASCIFKKPYLTSDLQLFSFCLIPLVLLFIFTESMRGLKKIVAYSVFQKGMYFLVGSILVFAGHIFAQEKEWVCYSFIIALAITSLSAFVYWKFVAPGKELVTSSSNDKPMNYNQLLTLSVALMLPSALGFVQSWTDTIILGIYRSEAEVGVYNIALRLASLNSLVLLSINSIAAPKFVELYAKGDMINFSSIAMRSTKMIFFLTAPLLIFFFLFPTLVLSFYGNEFKSGSSALVYMSIGHFISAISGSVGTILMMTGHQVRFQYMVLITSVLNFILSYLLIPQYGLNGAAISNMICLASLNLICLLLIYKKFGIFVAYIPFINVKYAERKLSS